MKNNHKQKQRLLTLDLAVKTAGLVFSLHASEFLERLLAQFYEYEDMMAIIITGVTGLLTFFLYIWNSAAIHVREHKGESVYLAVDSVMTKLLLVNDFFCQIACLSLNTSFSRALYREFTLTEVKVFWVVSFLVVMFGVLYYYLSSKYETESSIQEVSEGKTTPVVLYQYRSTVQ